MSLKKISPLLKKYIKRTYYFHKWFFNFFIYSPRFELYVKKLNRINSKFFRALKNDHDNRSDEYLKPYYLNSVPKKIWIYWAQGEINAPLSVKKCIESWRKNNLDWEVLVLDEKNVNTYVHLPNLPECLPVRYEANLLRTILLNEYGGVWADATTYCHRPLTQWLPLLANSGFYMFANPAEGRDIENWFIASTKNHPLIASWQERLEKYYLKMKKIHPAYFLAFYIYQWMLKQDQNLQEIQRKCSTLNAGPCFLMKSVLLKNTAFIELEKHIRNGLPLSKLDWRLEISDQEFIQYLDQIEEVQIQK